MRVVFGTYEAWLSPEFFVVPAKAYRVGVDVDEGVVARFPDAFTESLTDVPGFEVVETATAEPIVTRPRRG